MAREAFLKQTDDTILYAHTAAVTAGEVLNLAGVGVVIALDSVAINVSAPYYTKGVFQFPIGTGVTVAQGNRCYWDVSANAVILTGMVAGDFELGRAEAAGSAEAGYVDIRIGANAADYRTDGGLTAAKIAIAVGSRVVVGTELLETLTDARFQTTDTVLTSVEASFPTSWKITGVTKGTGSHVITFETAMTAGVVAYSVLK